MTTAVSGLLQLLLKLKRFNKETSKLHRDLLYSVSPTPEAVDETFIVGLEIQLSEREREVDSLTRLLGSYRNKGVTQVQRDMAARVEATAQEALPLLEAARLAAERRVYSECPLVRRSFIKRPLGHLCVLEVLTKQCKAEAARPSTVGRDAYHNVNPDKDFLLDTFAVLSAQHQDALTFLEVLKYWLELDLDTKTQARIENLSISLEQWREATAHRLETLHNLDFIKHPDGPNV